MTSSGTSSGGSLHDHQAVGGGLTWVLSSHDVPRHPSRYALPPGTTPDEWLITDGTNPPSTRAPHTTGAVPPP